MTHDDDFSTPCDVCGQGVVDFEKSDVEAFSSPRDANDDVPDIFLRCWGCRVHTVVCNGGEA